jgi:hypothetical protein
MPLPPPKPLTPRRVALYGVDALVEAKKADLKSVLLGVMDDEKIRLREEVQEQIRRAKGAVRAARRAPGLTACLQGAGRGAVAAGLFCS